MWIRTSQDFILNPDNTFKKRETAKRTKNERTYFLLAIREGMSFAQYLPASTLLPPSKKLKPKHVCLLDFICFFIDVMGLKILFCSDVLVLGVIQLLLWQCLCYMSKGLFFLHDVAMTVIFTLCQDLLIWNIFVKKK